VVEMLVALNIDSPRWDCSGMSKETQPRYLPRVHPYVELDSHPCQSVGYPHFI
jgi:hypothetical protein